LSACVRGAAFEVGQVWSVGRLRVRQPHTYWYWLVSAATVPKSGRSACTLHESNWSSPDQPQLTAADRCSLAWCAYAAWAIAWAGTHSRTSEVRRTCAKRPSRPRHAWIAAKRSLSTAWAFLPSGLAFCAAQTQNHSVKRVYGFFFPFPAVPL
jgi:hypothetical protein